MSSKPTNRKLERFNESMLDSPVLRLGIVGADPCFRCVEQSANLAADIGAGMWYYVSRDQPIRVRGPYSQFRPLDRLAGQPRILDPQMHGVDVWKFDIMDRYGDEAIVFINPKVARRVTEYLEKTGAIGH